MYAIITKVFQEDTAIVGIKQDTLVWYMGKRCLGIVPIHQKPQTLGGTSHDMFVVQGFSENTVVRKLVGCKKADRVVLLEVSDGEDKNITQINCFDVDIQRTVFSKKLGTDEENGITRFTKSIELSVDEEYLFSVGVYIDATAGEHRAVQKGFLNAMKFNATLKEVTCQVIGTATHPEKKGMYRMHRAPSSDTLVVSSWTDVFVYSFANGKFEHRHSFLTIHSNLIYNVIARDDAFFTCSNDCDASYITY